MSEVLVVVTTTEKEEDAARLARLLVERELAACVQVIPRITSIYRWQGKVEEAGESLLFIKTTRAVYAALDVGTCSTVVPSNGGNTSSDIA